MERLKIFHPYGSLGPLAWQNRNGLPFGFSAQASILSRLADDIHTFTESITDENYIEALRKEVADASLVAFLGFAFHKQNLDLIHPRSPTSIKKILATALGVSHSDAFVVKDELGASLCTEGHRGRVEVEPKLDCLAFFEEYRRTLCA